MPAPARADVRVTTTTSCSRTMNTLLSRTTAPAAPCAAPRARRARPAISNARAGGRGGARAATRVAIIGLLSGRAGGRGGCRPSARCQGMRSGRQQRAQPGDLRGVQRLGRLRHEPLQQRSAPPRCGRAGGIRPRLSSASCSDGSSSSARRRRASASSSCPSRAAMSPRVRWATASDGFWASAAGRDVRAAPVTARGQVDPWPGARTSWGWTDRTHGRARRSRRPHVRGRPAPARPARRQHVECWLRLRGVGCQQVGGLARLAGLSSEVRAQQHRGAASSGFGSNARAARRSRAAVGPACGRAAPSA